MMQSFLSNKICIVKKYFDYANTIKLFYAFDSKPECYYL